MRPEFMAWRAKIDPDDEDDAALAARFLAGLPAADAALLREFGDEFVGGLAFEALVKPEGYLRDAALLFREWDFESRTCACPTTLWVGERDDKAMAGRALVGRAAAAGRRGRRSRTPAHLAALLTQWPGILRWLSELAQQRRVDRRDGGLRTLAACSNAAAERQQQRLAVRGADERDADAASGSPGDSRPAPPGSGSPPAPRSRSRAWPRSTMAAASAARQCGVDAVLAGHREVAGPLGSYAARSASWSTASAVSSSAWPNFRVSSACASFHAASSAIVRIGAPRAAWPGRRRGRGRTRSCSTDELVGLRQRRHLDEHGTEVA